MILKFIERDKTCRQKYYLITHMTKHTGEKLHQCTQCNKLFSMKGNRNAYLRMHTGEKLYQCNSCDKIFTPYCDLNVHTRTNSGGKHSAVASVARILLQK